MVSSHGFVNGVCPSPSCVYGLAASLLCRVLPPRAAIKNQRGIPSLVPLPKSSGYSPSKLGPYGNLSSVYYSATKIQRGISLQGTPIKNQRGIALNGPPSKFSVVLPSIRWARTDRELSSVYYSALTIDAYKPLYKAIRFNHIISKTYLSLA